MTPVYPEPEPELEPDWVLDLRADIAAWREEVAETEQSRRRTTDQTIRAKNRETINKLNYLIGLAEEAIAMNDPSPQKYGHDKSDNYTLPIPGRQPIKFNGHMYTSKDPIEKAMLERALKMDKHMRRLDPNQRPFWDIESGEFFGWHETNALRKAGTNLERLRAF